MFKRVHFIFFLLLFTFAIAYHQVVRVSAQTESDRVIEVEEGELTVGDPGLQPGTGTSCPADTRDCGNGTFVNRDPANSCQFPACPEEKKTDDEKDNPTATPVATPTTATQCVLAGCNSELCVDQATARNVVTPCGMKAIFGCYRTATCAVQANGQCGFTETPELTACLAAGGPSATASPIQTVRYKTSDFNKDGKTDLTDYAVIKSEFLKTGKDLKADIYPEGKGDGIVNLYDYEVFSQGFSL